MFVVYSRIFRYILFFVTLAMMIFSFSVRNANKKLTKQISKIDSQIKQLRNKMYFEKNFYSEFLQNSWLSYMIISHKNWIPVNWEIVIRLRLRQKEKISNFKSDLDSTWNVDENSNLFYWYSFLKEKLNF